MTRNVADDAHPPSPSAQQREMSTWTAEEVGRFLEAADALAEERASTTTRRSRKGTEYSYTRTVAGDPMQVALWYVAALTGMRRGEVCGLRRTDLDLGRGTASVQRARVMVGGRVEVSSPKTSRGRRVVERSTRSPLASCARGALPSSRSSCDAAKAWQDCEPTADGKGRPRHVFTHVVRRGREGQDSYGVPIRPDWMCGAFRALAAQASLPPIRFHDLRHSWATLALAGRRASEDGRRPTGPRQHLGRPARHLLTCGCRPCRPRPAVVWPSWSRRPGRPSGDVGLQTRGQKALLGAPWRPMMRPRECFKPL